MTNLIFDGVLLGLGATVAMDLWALLLAVLRVNPAPNWALPGRWFWHVSRGRVFHDDIAAAEPFAAELKLGWAGHYAVGIAYGVIFALLAGPEWLAVPAFLPAWIFALVTIAAGWFLMQPGMGLGWAAAKTAKPWRARVLGLAAHTAFGLGLWLTGLALAP
ncbi:DUF2938 family protein [Rhodobacteraceae bacterium 2CG4]|uniref:DUF2938 family protein n=1 Tax=Halovulum marinum TaxID=2662447 RepID=A0A6L5YUT8_9RHOB|nr:DUF2938 domain-containing protein [Halovulum marinum]MSU88048.1 DUF2938 family protein [Halovulum marinum]